MKPAREPQTVKQAKQASKASNASKQCKQVMQRNPSEKHRNPRRRRHRNPSEKHRNPGIGTQGDDDDDGLGTSVGGGTQGQFTRSK